MAYLVNTRTREIGIRLAVGATRGDVMRLVLSTGLRLGLIAAAIGLPLALGGGRGPPASDRRRQSVRSGVLRCRDGVRPGSADRGVLAARPPGGEDRSDGGAEM